jgi:hypothetical protein
MIDLKDFKKVSQDKNSATLQHPKGHKITVIVSKLTPIQKEALKRLDMSSLEDEGKSRKQYKDGSKDGPVSSNDDTPETEDAPELKKPASPVTVNNIVPRESGQAPVPQGGNVGVVGDTGNLPAAVGPLQQEAQGHEQQADVQSKIAEQSAKDKAAYDAFLQQKQNDITQNAEEIKQHTDAFNDYSKNNKVRPDAYYEDMSTPKKITNAVGMLLAGFGGAGAQAMDYLNKQIDRNVAAQEQNFQHQNTIWHAYESLYHDKNIATSMAKATGAEMLANQISQTAERYGTAQAQAAKNIALGNLGTKHAQEIGMAATRLSALRNGEIPPNPGPAGQKAMKQKEPNNGGPWSDDNDNANAEPKPQDQEKDVSILDENSQKKWEQARLNPKFKDQYGKITDEYNQAVQSQKAMDEIEKKFPQLASEATLSGNLSSKINPHGVAAVGGALGAGTGFLAGGIPSMGIAAAPAAVGGATLGAAAGEGIAHGAKAALETTGGQKQVQYEADKAATTKVIAAALKGTNVSSEQIQDVVDSNTPSYWDDDKTYKKKLNNIKSFIKQNTITGTLDAAGITRK